MTPCVPTWGSQGHSPKRPEARGRKAPSGIKMSTVDDILGGFEAGKPMPGNERLSRPDGGGGGAGLGEGVPCDMMTVVDLSEIRRITVVVLRPGLRRLAMSACRRSGLKSTGNGVARSEGRPGLQGSTKRKGEALLRPPLPEDIGALRRQGCRPWVQRQDTSLMSRCQSLPSVTRRAPGSCL